MKLLGSGLSAQIDTSPLSDYWYQPFGLDTYTGKPVNEVTAMNVSAYKAGVQLLGETMGMLPVFIFRRTGETEKRKDLRHPLHDLLHSSPNQFQDSMQWFELMTVSAIGRGDGFSEIIPGRRGFADELMPLEPGWMEVELQENRTLRYIYTPQGRDKKTYRQEDIFQLKGFGYGLRGLSLLTAMRQTLGLALAMEEHAARFFGQGSRPSGYVSHPSVMKTESLDRLEKSFNENYSGVSQHYKTLFMEEGMEWKPISISNKDSQFLEGRKFLVNEIARWLRLPPHMLGDLERATFDNISEQDLEFVKYAILPWVKRWELAILNQLITVPQTFFAEFILEMLLRADIETRMKAYQIAIQNRILTPNEVRELENRNPLEGGDEPMVPLNMTTGRTPDGQNALIVKQGDDYKVYPIDENGTIIEGRTETVEPSRMLPVNGDAVEQLPARADSIIKAAADRVIRKEVSHVKRLAERDSGKTALEKAIRKFYTAHVGYVEEALSFDESRARRYCAQQMGEVLFEGPEAVETWGEKRTEELAAMALQGD